jgi:hypothetical protein
MGSQNQAAGRGSAPRKDDVSRVVVLRATSSLVTFWIVVGAAALGTIDVIARGFGGAALHALAPIGLGIWVAWFLLYRPSIRIESDALVVVNLGRITALPWRSILDIRRRFQVIVELENGSIVECWGGPFPGRTGLRRAGTQSDPSSIDPTLTVLRSALIRALARESKVNSGASVIRRWDSWSLGIGAILVVLTAVSSALPI